MAPLSLRRVRRMWTVVVLAATQAQPAGHGSTAQCNGVLSPQRCPDVSHVAHVSAKRVSEDRKPTMPLPLRQSAINSGAPTGHRVHVRLLARTAHTTTSGSLIRRG